MRVLVLTNHFSEFAGSEIVALEVAQWFLTHGDQVTLAANLIRPPMSELAASIALVRSIDEIDISQFDLVWCQHGLLNLLRLAAYTGAAESPPLVALVSLSPFEPYEHVDGLLANALSAKVITNSSETADEVAQRNQDLLRREDLVVFHNAAPDMFWKEPPRPPTTLRTLTIVSNHMPSELAAAKAILEQRGLHVRHMGMGEDYRRIDVADIDESDALVSIGKTVIYGLARAKPVYMYDHFGGDGWLTRANFEQSSFYNFSGRPAVRRLDAEKLAKEIIEGFDHAADEINRIGASYDLNQFRLDTYLKRLREQALKPRTWRAFTLQRALAFRRFRAHLEAARQSGLVMRRSYLLANGAALSERDHHPNLWSNRVNGGSSS
ncbi:MAG: hypothetical protein NT015_01120 [Alphaproteobacteria bacterium]|nr:hypothetical protein [Alphaproteobacteria bacterium]